MKKTFIINCPMCKGTLEIDLSSKKVIRHFAYKEKDENEDTLGDALEEIHKKDETLENEFEKLQEEKKKRAGKIEELFEEKKDQDDDGLPPPSPFGLD